VELLECVVEESRIYSYPLSTLMVSSPLGCAENATALRVHGSEKALVLAKAHIQMVDSIQRVT
jgi:hypothetical protein